MSETKWNEEDLKERTCATCGATYKVLKHAPQTIIEGGHNEECPTHDLNESRADSQTKRGIDGQINTVRQEEDGVF